MPTVNRRKLLQLLTAVAVSACRPGGRSSATALHTVVAGAGIVGASIAYHLAKRGVRVTVIEKTAPASHASRGTFAWVNATWAKQPRNYHALNSDSVVAWRVLQREVDVPLRWGGSLEWFESDDRQQRLIEQMSEQAEWGEPARMIERAEASRLEPQVDFGDTNRVAYSGNDGAVDPVAATQVLLRGAVELGARVFYPCELVGVSLRNGRLSSVDTTHGSLRADRLVLATGAAESAGRRFADCHIPQRSTPGVIVQTAPMERVLNRVLVAPGVHVHQRNDGRVVLGEQAGPPKTEAHEVRLADRPNAFPTQQFADEHARRILQTARQYLPLQNASIENVYIGWRPLPLDGHPVLGPSPVRRDVYFAVMHSGVSLAPLIGELAADELVAGEPIERLQPFRPGRHFAHVNRY